MSFSPALVIWLYSKQFALLCNNGGPEHDEFTYLKQFHAWFRLVFHFIQDEKNQRRRENEEAEMRERELKDEEGTEGLLNIIYIFYNSVCTCRHTNLNSSASAPLNATKIAVMKVSHLRGDRGRARIIIFDLQYINVVF